MSRTIKKANQVKHPYSSDRPITSKKHDVLERAKFAEHLASDLQSWNGDNSLVVALYGAWGSGKTSVKNMVLEANRRKRVTQLPVVEFNPWQLSRTGNIPAAFFQELGIALRQEWAEKDAEKGAKKLNAYAASLSLAGTTASLVGKAMPWFPGRSTQLDEKKLQKKEAIAVRAFRSALKRRAEGKPDDSRDRSCEEVEEVVN